MESLNFEHFRPKDSGVADLGAFAQACADSNPSSRGVKLPAAELLTGTRYGELRLQRPLEDDFIKLLAALDFKTAAQYPLLTVRKEGNQAARRAFSGEF